MAGEMWELAKTKLGISIVRGSFETFVEALKTEDVHYLDRKRNGYLHLVCTSFHPFYIHRLVAAGIDIDAQNKHGNTALHVTALASEPCHIPDLMACGIDPLIRNKDGKTAEELSCNNIHWEEFYTKYSPGIYQCVLDNDRDRLQQLINCWCNVGISKNGLSARKLAADLGHRHICNIIDAAKMTQCVIFGVLEGNTDKVRYGLDRTPCNVNLLNEASLKPHILQYAIELNEYDAVRMLCQAGADVNTPIYINGFLKGPLYFEVIKADGEINARIADKVMNSGCDVNLRDERGRTPLIYALDKTNGDISIRLVKSFLDKGTDIGARDMTGSSARDLARFAQRKDVVEEIDKCLIHYIRNQNIERLEELAVDDYDDFSVEYNHRDTWLYASGNEKDEVLKFLEWLPKFKDETKKLRRFIRAGSLEEVKTLLANSEKHKLLLRAKDKGGRTPLHIAVLFNREDIVNYLISTDPTLLHKCQDNLQRTPLHYAYSLNEDEAVNIQTLLESHGANTQSKDTQWKTPLQTQEDIKLSCIESFIPIERNKSYSLEIELSCLEKYEQLSRIIYSSRKGLKEFMESLKGFKYPVAYFPKIIALKESPLVQDFNDLIFLTLDARKYEITRQLVLLGADCQRQEKWPPSSRYKYKKPTENKLLTPSNEIDTTVEENQQSLMNAAEVANYTGQTELLEFIHKQQRTLPELQIAQLMNR